MAKMYPMGNTLSRAHIFTVMVLYDSVPLSWITLQMIDVARDEDRRGIAVLNWID